MRKIKSPYLNNESNFKLMLKRYKDIENGIVIPTFEEFFGKSNLLENMAICDIQKGKGLCTIDPHGDVAEDILHYIPEERNMMSSISTHQA